MSRIKLYTKNFVILFISMQLVNLMIVYFKTKQFVFEITSVQAFIIIYIIGLFYNVILYIEKIKTLDIVSKELMVSLELSIVHSK